MKRGRRILALACVLDAVAGDPAWLPHPVRLMGAAIAWGERRFNAAGTGSRSGGALLALGIVGAAIVAGAAAQRSVPIAIVLGASTLATRDLLAEVSAVADALERESLEHARARVARIVGRDTAALDAAGVARAAIETLAESACDGVVAPLFWFAVGGLPAALGFKAASTLDSMIGHRETRYLRFGAFAARLDDVLNFIPARVTALFIAFAGRAPLRVLAVARADAPRHASPNAGWPEAAIAAALDLRLGGPNTYGGMLHTGPVFNAAGGAPDAPAIRRALRVTAVAMLAAELAAIVVCR